ncbi:MAG TPA: primosomal protein N' [Thermohalobaculum sp.]|nr:primosomal protein N' [Thermohalobaculum sp.]
MNAPEARPESEVAVLLPMPFDGPLDYAVPPGMALAPGDFVEVELGTHRTVGVVWGAGTRSVAPERLKPVAARLDVPPMPPAMRRFLERAADYTMTPLGMMLRLATRVPELGAPPRLVTRLYLGAGRPERMTPARARVIAVLEEHGGMGFAPVELARLAGVTPAVLKGLAAAGALEARQVPGDQPYPPMWGQTLGQHLSDAQREAAELLRADVAARRFSTTLLKGVTGSGKTEVYLEAVAECIAQGRQALVLLPEVALTAGFLARVEARFGARPAEWHHGVTGAERRRCWRAVAEGGAGLVVGARSALFLPFRDLGLIVIDEEHETSFKQEDIVLYHARDMGVLRASIEGAVAVLASATPSLETWANADSGKYRRIDLPERFGAATLPEIRMIDLRRESPGRDRWLSEPLVQAVRARIARGEQAMLFLNRRGYAPLTLCRACGHHFGCPHCDAWLVTHRYRAQLLCHQCGHTEALPRACPNCGRDDRLAACGPGVERVAEEAVQLFPGARIEVLSSDLAGGTAELKERLAAVARGEADIVIGTQMVAKGHNFPLLTLVGVVDADMGLHGGDLRAAERTFQLMHQVAGRAGRADKPGAALIQTACADHPVMRAILSGDEEAFWRAEAEARHQAGVPPYGRMAGVIVSGPDEAKVWEIANALGRSSPMVERAGAEVFGPAPAPIARVRGRSRVRLLVKAPKGVALQAALNAWRAAVKVPSAVRVVIDIDPQSFL